ncbi:MAG: tetratricopeptide repeat protein [Myxococcota bacterium]
MQKSTQLNEHETALVLRAWGSVYASQEDPLKAISALEAALATRALPSVTELSVQYDVGQLYIVTERYRKGIEILEEWLALTEVPTADAYILMANAWVQLEDYRTALPLAEKAIEMSVNNPREGWIRLLLALHFQLEQYPEAAGVLEQLLTHWPKKTYWMQLSSVYATLGEDQKSLEELERAYREGYLTESRELIRLAHLYLFHGMPRKAAEVLEKGLEDGTLEPSKDVCELLGNAWIRAHELDRALEALDCAAKVLDDGNIDMRIGQIHVESEDWKRATSPLNKAIEKGGLDRPGLAYLLLGIAYFNLGDMDAAERSFQHAYEYDRSRKSARQWLRHITEGH